MSISENTPAWQVSTLGTAGEETPWAEPRSRKQPAVTSRRREVVRGLPSWSPEPVGEILVQRKTTPKHD